MKMMTKCLFTMIAACFAFSGCQSEKPFLTTKPPVLSPTAAASPSPSSSLSPGDLDLSAEGGAPDATFLYPKGWNCNMYDTKTIIADPQNQENNITFGRSVNFANIIYSLNQDMFLQTFCFNVDNPEVTSWAGDDTVAGRTAKTVYYNFVLNGQSYEAMNVFIVDGKDGYVLTACCEKDGPLANLFGQIKDSVTFE